MLRTSMKVMAVIVAAMLLSLLWIGTVAAQAPRGTGPDDALVPTGEWVTLKSGESHWYAFRFDYDEDRVAKPVEIRLYSGPHDGAVLTVHNAEQAELWRQDGTLEHFGCCTLVDTDKNDDGKPDYAMWAGTLRSSGVYYIVVGHAKNITEPVRYRFTISGEGLSFPTLPPAAAAKPAPAAVKPAEVKPVVLSGLEGTGPDYAMRPTGDWVEIKPGEHQWYMFAFDYDEDRVAKPMEIRMYTDVFDGATLTVHNEEQANLWRDEGKYEHFGCCTMVDEDKDEDGHPDYAIWAGTLRSSGRYYIVVSHAENITQPVRYRFTITGEGLSFPTPATKPAAAPAQPAPVAEVIKPKVLKGLDGTGPDYALAPTEEWMEIKSGEYHWFAFRFDYDADKAMQPVEIRFYTDVFDGATLTVRNVEQAELWRKEGEHEHFGCCTLVEEDKDDDGRPDYALWSANLRTSGTYYIVVEHAKNVTQPVHYHFEISGDGISF